MLVALDLGRKLPVLLDGLTTTNDFIVLLELLVSAGCDTVFRATVILNKLRVDLI